MRLSHTLVGVSTGVDYRFTPTVTAGVGMGFGRDVSDIGDTGTRSNGRSLSTALYASYHPDAVFVDGLLGYSRLDFDSKRHVSETDVYARGSRAGSRLCRADLRLRIPPAAESRLAVWPRADFKDASGELQRIGCGHV